MKVLHCADLHLKGGFKTREAEALMKVSGIALEEKVQLVCVNGDIFDSRSTPEQRLVFRYFIDSLTNAGIPVIILRGNHDEPMDLQVFESLKVTVSEKPMMISIPGLNVHTIPHFNAGGVALKKGDLSGLSDEGTGLFNDIMEGIFQSVQTSKEPSIVLFHAVVSGASLDNGMIPKQNGIHLNASKLDSIGCPVIGGHYHFRQKIGRNIEYSGSLTRQTFGEAEGDKGVLITEHDGEQWLETRFISVDPVPMVLIDAVWNGSQFTYEPVEVAGSDVRFRYSVTRELLPTVDLSHIEYDLSQALTLKIEQIITSDVTARTPEIGSSQTVEEALRVWAKASNKNSERFTSALERLREMSA